MSSPHPHVVIEPGLCSVTFRGLTPEAVIAAAAAAELRGIEWGADVHVVPGDTATATRIARHCGDVGVACPSYGTYLGVDTNDDDVKRACETALVLGATNLRVWTPFGQDHTAEAGRRAEITAGIARLAAVAADHELTVGVEFHGWTLTHTARSAARLIADVDASNLYSYWQPNYWDEEVAGAPARQLEELEVVLNDLSHLHVYWWRGLERYPLSDGEMVMPDCLNHATRAGRWSSTRYAFLEFVAGDSLESFSRDAATLRSWLAAGPNHTATV